MSMFLTKLAIDIEADSTVRAVIANYSEMVGDREFPVGTKTLDPVNIEQHLPTAAQLLAQIQQQQATIEAATKERDDAVAARVAADAERDQARKDAADAVTAHNEAMSAAAVQKAALEAQVAERDAQLVERDARIGSLQAQIAELTAAPPVAKTYTGDLWRRATDAEGAILEAIIAALPAKQRGLINAISYLDHADPQFPEIQGALAQAFGPDRAAELLAPSA